MSAKYRIYSIQYTVYNTQLERSWETKSHTVYTPQKANTKLKKTSENKSLFYLIERAEKWLRENKYSHRILKWETKAWGENPADFGRK